MRKRESERTDASDAGRHEMSLSTDVILSLLADQQRRDLLHYLIEAPDGTFTLEECVGSFMEQEKARRGEQSTYKRIEAIFHHVHLPKLSNAGVCEYDARNQVLGYYGHEQLETWLARIQEATA